MTTTRRIEVTAPSRLHFGLLNLGHTEGRRFGGVGLMIDTPGLRLRIEPAERFSVEGPLAERIVEFAERWSARHGFSQLPDCAVDVAQTPRQHVGLGTGTQLAIALAAGLCSFQGWSIPTPNELAVSVGRGRRSAIGTHGFALGGLLAERGCLKSEPIAPLDAQLDMPEPWRVVLTCPAGEGLSGSNEEHAFERLPPVSSQRSEQLKEIIRDQMFPAAAQADFCSFSDAVYRYGLLSGECFAPIQGGPYNGPRLENIVQLLRSLGVAGVGQSSWGPTVFAIVESAKRAAWLRQQVQQRLSLDDQEVVTSTINSGGARIKATAELTGVG